MVKVSSILLLLATVLIATEAVVAAPSHPASKAVTHITHHKSTPKTHKGSHSTTKAKKPKTKSKVTKSKATKATKSKATKATKSKATKSKGTKGTSKTTKSKDSTKGSHTHNHGKAHTGKALSATDESILNLHNSEREAHRSPALIWNPHLAAFAQKWASGCQWQHSNNGVWGENLALQFPTWDSAIQAWYNEGESYNYNNPGFSSSTGHFTQLVWKSTTELGCGSANCPNLNGIFYVCEYNPPGNMISNNNTYFRENVLPA